MTSTTATVRSPERMQALGYILSDGLYYSWFDVTEIDSTEVTATVRTEGPDDEEGNFSQVHKVNADDVARGLRMYREYLEGNREGHPGEWTHLAQDMLRKRFGGEQDQHREQGHVVQFFALGDDRLSRDYEMRCDCGTVWIGGGAALKAAATAAIEAGEFIPSVHARADDSSYGWQTVKFDRTNGAEGDYDANTADSVMQFAILGHTIYS